MAGTNYPTALDDDTSLIVVVDTVTDVLAVHHNYLKDAVKAIETKLGIGADTATVGKFLVGNTTAGSSQWRVLAEADMPVSYLKLDQTSPQAIINGIPTMAQAATAFTSSSQIVNKAYADLMVPKSTYDANSILIATSDNTPIALTIGASTIVGRKATGDIVALTATEVRTIINVADGATANAKNTGAEIDTGADDTKFSTAKSIADSLLIKEWVPVAGTFTYASATTINVSSDATTIFQKGDKLRFQNNDSGTYLYVYVVGVAATLLTVVGDAVPNATLTDVYRSRMEKPWGFPTNFAYTSTIVGITNVTKNKTRFSINGSRVFLTFILGGEGNTTGFTATLPVTAMTLSGMQWTNCVRIRDNSVWLESGIAIIASAGTVVTFYTTAGAGGWTAANAKDVEGEITYEI